MAFSTFCGSLNDLINSWFSGVETKYLFGLHSGDKNCLPTLLRICARPVYASINSANVFNTHTVWVHAWWLSRCLTCYQEMKTGLWVFGLAANSLVPEFKSHFLLLLTQAMAQMTGFLPLMWESWLELLAPGPRCEPAAESWCLK